MECGRTTKGRIRCLTKTELGLPYHVSDKQPGWDHQMGQIPPPPLSDLVQGRSVIPN